MKRILSLAALVISSCHSVEPSQHPQFDRYGQQIVFQADSGYNHKTGEHGAFATYVGDVSTVFYNPYWFSSLPKEMQTFFFQHEVAHFRLKHVKKKPYFASQKQMILMELQADGHSLLYLENKLHYTPEKFEKIFDFAELYLEEYRVMNLKNCWEK